MQVQRASRLFIVQTIIKEILARTGEKISEKEFIKGNMNLYSSNRMISLVNQLGDQLLSLPNEQRELEIQPEPVNLGEDTLMSLMKAEAVQQVLQPAKALSEHKSTERSHYNHNPRLHKNVSKHADIPEEHKEKKEKESHLHKLAFLEQKEEQAITEIRREKEREMNEEKERINKQRESSKRVKMNKDGVNFDYNGNVIEIKTEKKNNLISKVVTPKIPIDEPDKKSIQKVSKNTGTFIKTHLIKEGEEKTKKVSKYREAETIKYEDKPQILFSKIKNPIENIEVKEGVKAIFNQNTLQKERKKLTDEELKQSRSNRKLSKNEYARIKTSTLRSRPQTREDPNVETIEPIVNLKDLPKHDQPPYTTNMKKRAVTEFEAQKIKVEDTFLRKELIQRPKQPEEQRQAIKEDNRPLSEVKKKEELSKMDKYNLNYSRNKTQYSAMKKVSDNDAVLPKIHLKTQTNYPKVRQKLKQASSIRREVMKKFEQTLRV